MLFLKLAISRSEMARQYKQHVWHFSSADAPTHYFIGKAIDKLSSHTVNKTKVRVGRINEYILMNLHEVDNKQYRIFIIIFRVHCSALDYLEWPLQLCRPKQIGIPVSIYNNIKSHIATVICAIHFEENEHSEAN